MYKHLILTIISDDKPGIIKQIAKIVSEHDGNWLESQLNQLGGKFAGVVRLSLLETNIDSLSKSLNQLEQHNIQIQLDTLPTTEQQPQKRTANFTATGPDRSGIVLEITQALTEYNINVEDLTTNCTSMPYSGDPLFEAKGSVNIPDSTDLDLLLEQLDNIANKLGVDVVLEEN